MSRSDSSIASLLSTKIPLQKEKGSARQAGSARYVGSPCHAMLAKNAWHQHTGGLFLDDSKAKRKKNCFATFYEMRLPKLQVREKQKLPKSTKPF